MVSSYKKELNGITISLNDSILEISGNNINRRWKVTDYGLKTIGYYDVKTSKEWCSLDSSIQCDWELPGENDTCASTGILESLKAELSNDSGFTSEHVRLECNFKYKARQIELLFTVWIYPEFCGMRTQFQIKCYSEYRPPAIKHQGTPHPRRVEILPANPEGLTRRYIGYYSDTQNRNDILLDILDEKCISSELKSPEFNTWASAVCLEDASGGIAMVKESHKCVNNSGHDTGIFVVSPETGVTATGWGIVKDEMPQKKYASSWAVWTFCWNGDSEARETAFKHFDRLRYPGNPNSDVYIQANTWGSTTNGVDARNAAGEQNVLKEIDSCAEIGIDILQIDDGWQVPVNSATYEPEDHGWYPHPERYPDGWNNVVAEAKDKGVSLGLWAAAECIPLKALEYNYENGHFVQFKLDFAHLDSRHKIDKLMHKVKSFIKSTGHNVRVNWDLTEINPRYGYFFARDCGSIYLANRKPVVPVSAIYRPATMLRDLWQISKYINLNKFQGSYQNIDMVDPNLSNARYYTHAYCLAITMMGIPLFFQETQYLSAEAKQELIPLIKAYKTIRHEMFEGYVYPIGDKPSDASWTGFQNHNAITGKGFLTIFRELNNPEPTEKIALKFVEPGVTLNIKNIQTGEETKQMVDESGKIKFHIDPAPGFLLLSYDFG